MIHRRFRREHFTNVRNKSITRLPRKATTHSTCSLRRASLPFVFHNDHLDSFQDLLLFAEPQLSPHSEDSTSLGGDFRSVRLPTKCLGQKAAFFVSLPLHGLTTWQMVSQRPPIELWLLFVFSASTSLFGLVDPMIDNGAVLGNHQRKTESYHVVGQLLVCISWLLGQWTKSPYSLNIISCHV